MGRGVSRKHLRLERLGDEVTVEDLQSTNGTLINGEIILRHRLRPGDRIQLGPDTRLRLSYEDTNELKVRAQKYEESIRDDLTGAYNRRFFRLTLTHEFAFASRHKVPTSVALIDLDLSSRPTIGLVIQPVIESCARWSARSWRVRAPTTSWLVSGARSLG